MAILRNLIVLKHTPPETRSARKLTITVIAGLLPSGYSPANELPVPVLEEIIVTAEKRSASLRNTPKTINVMSGEQIRKNAIFNLDELNNLTSGLAISSSDIDANIAVRGLATDLNDAAVVPRVTVYLDGAIVTAERGLFTGLYDLEQIELLRGPQGALYGQPSPAGVLTIQSQNPNLEQVDGYIQQSFSNRSGSNSQFGVSLPVMSDKLGVRVSGMYDNNEHREIENRTLDKSPGTDIKAYRIVGYWTPTDDLKLRLAYHDNENDVDVDPVVKGKGIGFEERIALAEFDSLMQGRSKYWILNTDYKFANDWTATLVASKQDNTIDLTLDMDATPVPALSQRLTSDLDDVYSAELRLTSPVNKVWDWIVGAFYQDAIAANDSIVDVLLAPAPGNALFVQSTGEGIVKAKYLGLFTYNTFHFPEHGTLTVGIRYNELTGYNSQTFRNDVYSAQPDGSLGLVGNQTIPGVSPEDQKSRDDALTGSLKYQYRFNHEFMVYASYDRGWRAGSVKTAGSPIPPPFRTFDAEHSDSFEIGSKWQILDGRGMLNMALYYQTYSGFHYLAETVAYRDILGGISLASPIISAKEAESSGFDSDISLQLNANWRFSAALSYNRTEFSDAEDIPCTSGAPILNELWYFNDCDLTGERAGTQPRWSGNLATEYHRALDRSDSEWYLRALLNAESEYYSPSEGKDLDSYTTLDLFLGLKSLANSWDISIWVKNVFDESAELKTARLPALPDFINGGAIDSGFIRIQRQLNPRTAGVTLTYRFCQGC